MKRIKRYWLPILLVVVLAVGTCAWADTQRKSYIGKEDVSWWDGVLNTFTRRTGTGGSLTLTKMGDMVDVLEVYGNGTSRSDESIRSAISMIGTPTAMVGLFLARGTWTVDSNLTVPVNMQLILAPGAIISDGTGTATLTLAEPLIVQGGRVKCFDGFTASTGAGTVVLTKTIPVYPEWWGAVADGDATTDDALAIQAAITSAPFGGIIELNSDSTLGYYIGTTMIDISGEPSRRLTVQGEATIYSTATGIAFRSMSRATTLKNFTLQASSGLERNNAAQVGLLIANQTGSMYDHLQVKDFYTNYKLYVYTTGSPQQPTWLETTKFFALYSTGGQFGFWIGTDKATWQSFATLEFYGCAVDVNSDTTSGVGVYIGPNVDLYRGYMDISVHPKATNSRGFEYHGRTTAFTGRWMGECHSGTYPANTGQTGIYIGNDAKRLDGAIETDWMACPNPYERQDTDTIVPNGFYTMDNKGFSHLVWNGKTTTPISFSDAGFYTIKTNIVTGATKSVTDGASTLIACSAAHDLNPGDRAVINGVDSDNPFYSYLDWESVEVLTTPTTTTFTVAVNTFAATGVWKVGDVASLRGGNVKLQMNVSGLDYVQFISPGGRFSFLQSNNDSYNNNVAAVWVPTCKRSSDIGLNDPTLDVSGCPCVILDNTSATTITSLLGTTFGNPANRVLIVHHENANTGMTYGASLRTLQQQNVVGQTGMTQIFMQISDQATPYNWYWWEISRTYNVHIRNVWAHVNPAAPAFAAQVGQTFLCTDCRCGGAQTTYPIVWDGTNWVCGNGDTSPDT